MDEVWPFADRLAAPGLPGLDFDVTGLTVTAVVVEGREILVHAGGGEGGWLDPVTGSWSVVPSVHALDIGLAFTSVTDRQFEMIVDRLEEWRDQATPVRMLAGPGMTGVLQEANPPPIPFVQPAWVPVPRRAHPSWRT